MPDQRSLRLITTLQAAWLLPATCAGLLALTALRTSNSVAQSPPEPFQLVFGNRLQAGQTRATSDSGHHLVEADNGDIIVGGLGDMWINDTDSELYPLLARIDSEGTLRWQRTYRDLRSHQPVALVADDTGEYVLLARPGLAMYRIGADGALTDTGTELNLRGGVITTGFRDAGVAGFLVTGIDGARVLLEWRTNGSLTHRIWPADLDEPESLTYLAGGNVLVRTRESAVSDARQEVLLLSPDGSVSKLISLAGDAVAFRDIVASPDRVYSLPALPGIGGMPQGRSIGVQDIGSGQVATAVLPFDGTIGRTVITATGNLLIAGSYWCNPWIGELTPTGDWLWHGRFNSATELASVNNLLLLRDGRLAMTGTTGRRVTGPFRGPGIAGDTDAFLYVTGATADDLASFSHCLADAQEMESLIEELKLRAGIDAIPTEGVQFDDRLTPPINSHVDRTRECRPVTEIQFVEFLREAITTADAIGIDYPTTHAPIPIRVGPEGNIRQSPAPDGYTVLISPNPGEWVVGHRSGAATVRTIATDVAPFVERRSRATMGIEDRTGTRIRYLPYSPDRSFREQTLSLEAMLADIENLPETDRLRIRNRLADSELHLNMQADMLLLDEDELFVGTDRIADILPYLLVELPALEAAIDEVRNDLAAALNARIDERGRRLDHAEFLDALRTIATATQELSADRLALIRSADVRIELHALRWYGEPELDIETRGDRLEVDATADLANRVLDGILAYIEGRPRNDPESLQ